MLCALTLTALYATAKQNNKSLYVKAQAGISMPANKFTKFIFELNPTQKPRDALIYNIALGYVVNNIFRADLSINHKKIVYKRYDGRRTFDNRLDVILHQKIRTYTGFINGYFDFPTKVIRPYLTAGIGYSYNTSSTIYDTGNYIPGVTVYPGARRGDFAWNAGAGIRYAINDRFNLSIAYIYADLGYTTVRGELGDAGDPDKTSNALKSHDIMVGIMFYL